MINEGFSGFQEYAFRVRQASRIPSWYSAILERTISVVNCRSYISQWDIPDLTEIVTLCTTWQTAVHISGESSTSSGSGNPGIGAIRTTLSADIPCKDGKVRWATTSRFYPLGFC
jgi:hypothetical protein